MASVHDLIPEPSGMPRRRLYREARRQGPAFAGADAHAHSTDSYPPAYPPIYR
jgi:hypothetical protein